jgi:hypothetical protein
MSHAQGPHVIGSKVAAFDEKEKGPDAIGTRPSILRVETKLTERSP